MIPRFRSLIALLLVACLSAQTATAGYESRAMSNESKVCSGVLSHQLITRNSALGIAFEEQALAPYLTVMRRPLLPGASMWLRHQVREFRADLQCSGHLIRNLQSPTLRFANEGPANIPVLLMARAPGEKPAKDSPGNPIESVKKLLRESGLHEDEIGLVLGAVSGRRRKSVSQVQEQLESNDISLNPELIGEIIGLMESNRAAERPEAINVPRAGPGSRNSVPRATQRPATQDSKDISAPRRIIVPTAEEFQRYGVSGNVASRDVGSVFDEMDLDVLDTGKTFPALVSRQYPFKLKVIGSNTGELDPVLLNPTINPLNAYRTGLLSTGVDWLLNAASVPGGLNEIADQKLAQPFDADAASLDRWAQFLQVIERLNSEDALETALLAAPDSSVLCFARMHPDRERGLKILALKIAMSNAGLMSWPMGQDAAMEYLCRGEGYPTLVDSVNQALKAGVRRGLRDAEEATPIRDATEIREVELKSLWCGNVSMVFEFTAHLQDDRSVRFVVNVAMDSTAASMDLSQTVQAMDGAARDNPEAIMEHFSLGEARTPLAKRPVMAASGEFLEGYKPLRVASGNAFEGLSESESDQVWGNIVRTLARCSFPDFDTSFFKKVEFKRF